MSAAPADPERAGLRHGPGAPLDQHRARTRRAMLSARRHRADRLTELARWLSMSSVSGDRRHAADVVRAADHLARSLRGAGAEVRLLGAGNGAPVVVGVVRGRADGAVVALYGHYDVVPPGPGWSTAAFRPTVRDGWLVARGTNDDKGQVYAAVAALHAWRAVGGPPATVAVIVEGAEELGSPGLRAALHQVAHRIRPDLVLACDSEGTEDGAAAITVAQRGSIKLSLLVRTAGPPVHPGRLGGAVLDPALVLMDTVGGLRRLIGRCRPPDPVTHDGAAVGDRRIHERGDSAVRRAAAGRATAPSRLDRRSTATGAVSVLELRSGAASPSVPSTAAALLDIRLPAEIDAREVISRIRRIAAARSVAGLTVQVTPLAAGTGHTWRPSPPALSVLDSASRRTYGRPIGFVRSGGSLPAAVALAEAFGRSPVLLGLAGYGTGAHGPDERLHIQGWGRSVEFLVRVFGTRCADLRAPPNRPLAHPGPWPTRSNQPNSPFHP